MDEDAIHLGFFSFSKFLIYKDLDPGQWPEDKQPADHPVIPALFDPAGFRSEPAAVGDDEKIDDHPKATGLRQVVDADSSQTLVVVDAMAGRNLVIQGPPGTGESQTVTNLVAEAPARGKFKVLFVAEKLAALEVVKRRLDAIHLGDACLELHSHNTNKRAVLDEPKRTLDLGRPATPTGIDDEVLKLRCHQLKRVRESGQLSRRQERAHALPARREAGTAGVGRAHGRWPPAAVPGIGFLERTIFRPPSGARRGHREARRKNRPAPGSSVLGSGSPPPSLSGRRAANQGGPGACPRPNSGSCAPGWIVSGHTSCRGAMPPMRARPMWSGCSAWPAWPWRHWS